MKLLLSLLLAIILSVATVLHFVKVPADVKLNVVNPNARPALPQGTPAERLVGAYDLHIIPEKKLCIIAHVHGVGAISTYKCNEKGVAE